MLAPLPAETVFEAKARARAHTAQLFSLLAGIYIVFVNLIVAVIFFDPRLRDLGQNPWRAPVEVYLWSALGALTAATLHFLWAQTRTLDDILKHFGSHAPDPTDQAHKRLMDLVEEAGIATGRQEIRPVILPTSAINAFSIEAAGGMCAIGATEGILARLNRSELEAVIAHEASHLAHGDSRVLATACSLFSVFDTLTGMLRPGRFQSRGRGSGSGVLVLVWLIAAFGRFLSKLVYMAISRNREYYADSEAVHMCKNPLALADALNKISSSDRGFMAVPEGFSAVFIMNPEMNARDETQGVSADLFSTHPPVKERVGRLMTWARQNAENARTSASTGGTDRPLFLHDGGVWQGPLSPAQAAASVAPATWVLQGNILAHAAENPDFQKQFAPQPGETGTGMNCPRCRTPLISELYEGMTVSRCKSCEGRLLPPDGILRAIARRQAQFDDSREAEVKKWRALQHGTLKDLCKLPHIDCPRCGKPMFKRIHAEVTRVVVDVCSEASCQSVWCDPGELEKIEILIESYDKPNTG